MEKMDTRNLPLFKNMFCPNAGPVLEHLHTVARLCGVSYSLVYCEGSDDWYGTIDSAVPGEGCCTKSWGHLSHVVGDMLRNLYGEEK